MFPHTVTIYNKYVENRVEKWQRTVLKGVYWNCIKGVVTRKTGVTSADSLQLIIPCNIRANRSFKTSKEWQKLPDKSKFWTLQSGDTVVLGEITQEVVKTSSELDFDNCLRITSVDSHNYGSPMAHWEVGAK